MDVLLPNADLPVSHRREPWSAEPAAAQRQRWTHTLAEARAAHASRRHLRRGLMLLGCIAVLLAGLGAQSLYTAHLSDRLEQARAEVEALDKRLLELQAKASTREDVQTLRTEIDSTLDGAQARVAAVEKGSVAPLVSQVAQSVALIQTRFVLIDPANGRPVRLAMAGKQPRRTSDGELRFTLTGNGPIYMFRSTGTAFVVDSDGTLITNRHVALPWEHGDAARAMAEFGVRPMALELRGFLPDTTEPFAASVVGVSGTHDLALLRGSGAALQVKPLPMAAMGAEPGDSVLVLGYPTGLNALLARADRGFVRGLREQEDMNDQKAADALAQARLIQPLVSRGIVAQVSNAVVVHDAQTTFGGSGGPVINLRGEVLAVNRSMLAGFGGANMGVPVQVASQLLEAEGESRRKAEQPN